MGLCAELGLAALMLLTGSINTASKKMMYQTEGTNIDGNKESYQKPWLCTLVMFCGETLCLVFFYLFAFYYKCCSPEKPRDEEILRSATDSENPTENKIVFVSREEVNSDPTGGLGWRFPLYAMLFASCDLLSTTLTGIGLVYCDASVVQILRGFVIVFTMFMAWIFLDRKPKLIQVVGVLFALTGLISVGVAAVISSKGDTHKTTQGTVLGIGLVLLSQLFSSVQFVLEEKLLKQNSEKTGPIPALFLVGSEGLAGAILSIAVALPICNAIPGKDHGSYENLKNSVYMLFHNDMITFLQFLYFASIAFFNWFSFVYSKALTSTARTLVDACRTIVVWAVMVTFYYTLKHKYGEGVNCWSILQGFGFILMLTGTTIHNNIAGAGDAVAKCCENNEYTPLTQK